MQSAQLCTQSVWCAAKNCGNDAEPSGLCAHHERLRDAGTPIELHHTTQPRAANPATELYCPACETWKPDADFTRRAAAKQRRQHANECKTCANKRRQNWRTRNPPQRCAALTTTPDNAGHAHRPCRNYATPGSAYCSSHRDAP